jgi:hypothetical protein
MSIILTTVERRIYENIAAIKGIAEICSEKKEFWIEQLRTTIEVFSKLTDTQGQQVMMAPRELIGLTIIRLSYIEDEFQNEIDKLEYKEKVSDKTAYNRLKGLRIYISGIGDLDLLKKGLFLVLAKFAEDSVFKS